MGLYRGHPLFFLECVYLSLLYPSLIFDMFLLCVCVCVSEWFWISLLFFLCVCVCVSWRFFCVCMFGVCMFEVELLLGVCWFVEDICGIWPDTNIHRYVCIYIYIDRNC